MTKLSSSDSSQRLVRRRWLLLGISCLLIGGAYLGFADLTGAQIAEEQSTDNTLTSQGE